MSNINVEFSYSPKDFIHTKPLVQSKVNIPPPSGVVSFNLVKKGNYVELNFSERTKNKACKKLAYLLRFSPSAVTQLELNDEADFFFTSPLTGCQLRVLPGRYPVVLHAAGNVSSADDPLGTNWREMECKRILGDNFPRSRAISPTRVGVFGYGLHLDRNSYNKEINVIGCRNKQSKEWEFWAQEVRDVSLVEKSISRIWRFV